MAKFQRFEDIEAWKAARKLTNRIYDCSMEGEFSRDFAFRNQIRRASVSILSNIAEGFERDGNKEFLQYLSVAKGSGGEVRTQLYLAHGRNYITEQQFKELLGNAVQVSRMISGLMSYLRRSELTGKKYKTITVLNR